MNCVGKTKKGQPCRSHAHTDSEFCFFHDPALGRQRRQAQRKGGRNRSHLEAIPAPQCNFDLTDLDKSAELLNLVANRLVSGHMEAKVASAVGYIVSLAQRINEMREYQRTELLHHDHQRHVAPADRIDLADLSEQEVREILAELSVEDVADAAQSEALVQSEGGTN